MSDVHARMEEEFDKALLDVLENGQVVTDSDLIIVNPFQHLKGTAPEPDKDWRQLTEAEIARLLEACPTADWRVLFALCYYAGLRRGEALRLRWIDVLWDKNRIVVRNPGTTRTTKHRTREVLMLPELERILTDTLDQSAGGAYVYAGTRGNTCMSTSGSRIMAITQSLGSTPIGTTT